MITTKPRRQVFGVAIWRWNVINLVTLILGYSYLISLEIVVGYRKLRSFKETPCQFKSAARETRCHVSITKFLIRNF